MFKSPKSKFSAAAQSSLQDLLTPVSNTSILLNNIYIFNSFQLLLYYIGF